MNRNQVKGAVKDMAGSMQRKMGKATGSGRQQIKGGAKQVEGKIQKGLGDMQSGEERARKKSP